MPKQQYVFIDRRKVGGCDSLTFKNHGDVVGLPVGSYKTFFDQDSPEFAELNRDPNYRKVVFEG